MSDPNLSLEAIENDRWGDPAFQSGVVATCHALRTKPIGQLTPGELRILISQDIGLDHLVTLALDLLKADPLVEATFYPGDLLKVVLAIDSSFWQSHPELRSAAAEIASAVGSRFDSLDDDIRPTIMAFEELR